MPRKKRVNKEKRYGMKPYQGPNNPEHIQAYELEKQQKQELYKNEQLTGRKGELFEKFDELTRLFADEGVPHCFVANFGDMKTTELITGGWKTFEGNKDMTEQLQKAQKKGKEDELLEKLSDKYEPVMKHMVGGVLQYYGRYLQSFASKIIFIDEDDVCTRVWDIEKEEWLTTKPE